LRGVEEEMMDIAKTLQERLDSDPMVAPTPDEIREAIAEITALRRLVEERDGELQRWRDSRDGVMAENERLAFEWQQAHDYNNQLISERFSLKKELRNLTAERDRMTGWLINIYSNRHEPDKMLCLIERWKAMIAKSALEEKGPDQRYLRQVLLCRPSGCRGGQVFPVAVRTR